VLFVAVVWPRGTTIGAVADGGRPGGGPPTTAVLHYKPERSKVEAVPDFYAATTDAWVVYPFKFGS
jgi:hypothetical protein